MSAPQRVIVEPPRLDPDAKGYFLSALTGVALRTLIAWGVIAILIPQFGITYWMVYLGIVGLNAVRGPEPYSLVHTLNGVARVRRSSGRSLTSSGAQDDALLHARSKV